MFTSQSVCLNKKEQNSKQGRTIDEAPAFNGEQYSMYEKRDQKGVYLINPVGILKRALTEYIL